jgi:hypothetical protein
VNEPDVEREGHGGRSSGVGACVSMPSDRVVMIVTENEANHTGWADAPSGDAGSMGRV